VFGRLNVTENLEMGAYAAPTRGHQADMEKVFTLFPRLKERASATGTYQAASSRCWPSAGR